MDSWMSYLVALPERAIKGTFKAWNISEVKDAISKYKARIDSMYRELQQKTDKETDKDLNKIFKENYKVELNKLREGVISQAQNLCFSFQIKKCINELKDLKKDMLKKDMKGYQYKDLKKDMKEYQDKAQKFGEKSISTYNQCLNSHISFVEDLISSLKNKYKVACEGCEAIYEMIMSIASRMEHCIKEFDNNRKLFSEKWVKIHAIKGKDTVCFFSSSAEDNEIRLMEDNKIRLAGGVICKFNFVGEDRIKCLLTQKSDWFCRVLLECSMFRGQFNELFLMLLDEYGKLSNKNCKCKCRSELSECIDFFENLINNFVRKIIADIENGPLNYNKNVSAESTDTSAEKFEASLYSFGVDYNDFRKSNVSLSFELPKKIIEVWILLYKTLKDKLPEAEEILEKLKAKCAKCEK